MSKSYVGNSNGTVDVFIDGKMWLPLPRRLDIRNHSPAGFNWGYQGSGPAQLALAILIDLEPTQRDKVEACYQDFKREVIAALDPGRGFELSEVDCRNWLYAWEADCFETAWEYLADRDQVDAKGGKQHRRVYAAWRKAGAPLADDFFEWLLAECAVDNHVTQT